MTAEKLAQLLIKHQVICEESWYDADGYDGGKLRDRVHLLNDELGETDLEWLEHHKPIRTATARVLGAKQSVRADIQVARSGQETCFEA